MGIAPCCLRVVEDADPYEFKKILYKLRNIMDGVTYQRSRARRDVGVTPCFLRVVEDADPTGFKKPLKCAERRIGVPFG